MLSLLPRRSRLAEWAVTVIVAMAVIEMVVIVGQVVRGQTSHFNETTPLNARALVSVMGAAIMVLFVAHFVLGIVVLRQRLADRAAAHAVGLGLGLSLLGMLAAVPMVLPMPEPGIDGIAGAHSVGVPDGGPGLPLVGWSTTGGDLRIGHFVGLHALQALPLLAILLTRFATRLRRAHPGPAAGRRGRRVRRPHRAADLAGAARPAAAAAGRAHAAAVAALVVATGGRRPAWCWPADAARNWRWPR